MGTGDGVHGAGCASRGRNDCGAVAGQVRRGPDRRCAILPRHQHRELGLQAGTAAFWKWRFGRACGRATGTRFGTTARSAFRGKQTPSRARKSWTRAGKALCPMANRLGSCRSTWSRSTTPINRYEPTRSSAAMASSTRARSDRSRAISSASRSCSRSYGEFCKLKATTAESKIIFYYGVRSIPRPWSLVKDELDEHFGFPVVERIEQANEYFRTRLHTLLNAA